VCIGCYNAPEPVRRLPSTVRVGSFLEQYEALCASYGVFVAGFEKIKGRLWSIPEGKEAEVAELHVKTLRRAVKEGN